MFTTIITMFQLLSFSAEPVNEKSILDNYFLEIKPISSTRALEIIQEDLDRIAIEEEEQFLAEMDELREIRQEEKRIREEAEQAAILAEQERIRAEEERKEAERVEEERKIQEEQEKLALEKEAKEEAERLVAEQAAAQEAVVEESEPAEVVTSSQPASSYLLAQLVESEAKGEGYNGKVAVAEVVLNRVNSSQFPNSIESVIYQSGQFQVVSNGSINNTPSQTSIDASNHALSGSNYTNNALFFYNPAIATNRWLDGLRTTAVIGNHTFKNH